MLAPADTPALPAVLPPDPAAASAARRFFGGPAFLVFLLAALGTYEGFLLLTIFGNIEGGPLGDFMRDFRLWCYRTDPRTGGISWTSVAIMLLEPVFIVGVAAFLWREPLRQLGRVSTWLRHAGTALAGIGVVAAAVAGLYLYARAEIAAAAILPPFPGERIRVHLAVPDQPLIDQKGADFRLADLRGEVVLVTGVYATCTTTCPEIFTQVKSLFDSLTPAERAGVRVVALSLNPEYETASLMDAVSAGRGFSHPEFRYANGEPGAMHRFLQQLQFSANRNPQTGVIEHANLFLLLDRHGEIAYRFTLEPRHQSWLREGLLALLREPHDNTP